MHDILIKNGTIIDGSGAEKFDADIAINDGHITEIGDLSGDHARDIIDAKGLYVTPGFIDISNRSDTRWRLFEDPVLESMLYQGVTTIIGGNSGTSLAPIYSEEMLRSARKWVNVGIVNVDWQNMAEFLERVRDHHLALNFGTFVGYGTLRRGLTGDTSRELTADERTSIKKHIKESLMQGALGVSTGMIYSHEKKITTEELIDIGTCVAKNKKIFVAHLRNEGKDLLKSVDEMIEIQKKTKARIHISHLKSMMKQNWSLMSEAIKRIEKTDIIFDIYPYTFSETVLYTFLPEWVSEGGRRMMIERLRNKKLHKQIIDEMEKGPDLSHAVVAETMRSHYFCGKSFADIARTQNKSVSDAVIDVLLASEGQVTIFFESMSDENIVRGLLSEHATISTNGAGYTIKKRNEHLEHPRSFGAFPRVFARYVEKENVLSAELMIHKSTGKVAKELRIKDRGILAAGYVADIAVFDPKNFVDHAKADRPYHYASGVDCLFINGQMAIKYGKYTGIRSGDIITS